MAFEPIFHTLTTADINEIMEIERLSFRTPWSRYAFIHEIQFEKSIFKVCKLDGRLVGYGGFWHLVTEIHISNIAIHPNCRRKGLGKKLLVDLLEEAVARGASAASLEVRRSNIAAQKMYEGFGFRIVGINKNYYSDENEDALIMWNDDIPGALVAFSGRKIKQNAP